MQSPGVGQRYYYLPKLAWLGVLWRLALGRSWPWRWLGAAALALMVVNTGSHWRIKPRPPTGFAAEIRRFQAAPRGTTMWFPVDPPFADHGMILRR